MLRRSFLKLASATVLLPALRWTASPRVEVDREPVTTLFLGQGSWDDPARWTKGVPQDGDSVVITQGSSVIDGLDQRDVVLQRLTVMPGSEVGLPGHGLAVDSIDTLHLGGTLHLGDLS
jgi:hypothetical protein